MVLNFEPYLSSVSKQGGPRQEGIKYLSFQSTYRGNGCAWETGTEQHFTLQPLRALAAAKQQILKKSIGVDKPSAAYVEGIGPEDFIFCLGLLLLALITSPHYSSFKLPGPPSLGGEVPPSWCLFEEGMRDNSTARKKGMQLYCLCCQECFRTLGMVIAGGTMLFETFEDIVEWRSHWYKEAGMGLKSNYRRALQCSWSGKKVFFLFLHYLARMCLHN